MPPQALLLSLGAMAVPVASAFNAPSWMEGDGEAPMWLTALLSAVVLTCYKGWRGVSTVLPGGVTGFIRKPLTRASLEAGSEEMLATCPVPGDEGPEPVAEVASTERGVHA